MQKPALTDLSIRKLKAPERGRLEIADGKIPGLSLRVTPNGVKTFAVRARVNGNMVRVSLGRYPIMSLQEAREQAFGAVADIKAGRIESNRTDASFRFAAVVEDYLERQVARFQKERSAQETERILNVEFMPKWKDSDVRKIVKADVIKVIDAILKRPQKNAKGVVTKDESPSAANHAFEVIRAFFNWCVAQGKIEISPCNGLRKPAPKKKRDRTLKKKEIAAVWLAADEMGHPYGSIVQLLLATMQRRSEVVGLRWELLDLEERVWRVPAEENKSGREYLVPLSKLAVEVIERIPVLDDRLLFPGARSEGSLFADWSKSKKRIDKLSDVSGWTVHDLRRTGSTNLGRLGIAPHVKERVLNHAIGGVEGVYDVYSYLDEKREALDVWAAEIQKIVKAAAKASA